MTVHGAKGLEAPVVVLPDSTGAVNDKPDDNFIFDESGPYFSQREKDDDAAGRAARAAYKEEMLGEHWRLLYVAMTRARDRLIVCGAQHGSSATGETQESWRFAVEQALAKLGAEPLKTPTGSGLRLGEPIYAQAQARADPASHGLPPWAKQSAPGATAISFAAPSRIGHIDPVLFSPRGQGQKRFRRGLMIHALLERLPDVAPERRARAAKAWLAQQGIGDADATHFTQEALGVIGDARFAPLFGPNSRAEQPIIGDVDGRQVRGIVDRLAINNEGVMILDYKTDRPAPESADEVPDAYVVQLALYRNVLRKIFPSRAVTCALLWTESPRLMALPDARLDAALHALKPG